MSRSAPRWHADAAHRIEARQRGSSALPPGRAPYTRAPACRVCQSVDLPIRGEETDMKLDGKTAIITGGGSGIVRATALRLAREGAAIVVADWNEAGAKETVALVEQASGRAAAVKVDVRKSSDLTNMLEFAEKTY